MAAAYDDDSTDDEMGMNLQLAERLRINRAENFPADHSRLAESLLINRAEKLPADCNRFENSKDFIQFCNVRRKKQLSREERSSSSSSVDTHNEFPLSGMHSSFVLPNKKRQNGDKNLEQFANPKRTCLSDRFPKSSEWRDSKKKGNNIDMCHVGPSSLHRFSEHSSSNRGLHPDKTYEDHLNNLADAEDSDFDIPPHFSSYRHFQRMNGQNSRALQNHPSSSSSAIYGEPYESRPIIPRGAQFIDSGSDDDSKPGIQNGALKGGRQSPDLSFCNKKVLGRKVKKVLDSEDSDDENWPSGYRCKPLVFSSSDSEDEGQTTANMHGNGLPDSHANHSFSNDNPSSHSFSIRSHKHGLHSRCHRRSPTRSSYNAVSPFKSQSFSMDGCSSQFLASTTVPAEYQGKSSASKACRSRRSPRMNGSTSSTMTQSSFVPNISSPGPSVRGRNRVHGSIRSSRGTGNTLPKSMLGQRRSEAKSSRGRSLSSTHTQREKLNLAATYPDLFDAEDSSEVEFFTANSYSDTEASNESIGGLTINATFVSSPDARRDIVCEHSVNIGSSEDEISVVFSTVPHARNSEQRRGARALGRRYGRGAGHRHLQNSQDVVSLSPDPVEQVRQMEEDERFARMLQAQFDAELNVPRHPPTMVHHDTLLEDSDDSIIDPVGDSDSEDTFHTSLLPFVHAVMPISSRGGFRMHRRYPSRPGTPNLMPPSLIFSNRRSDGRTRRGGVRNEPRSWQFARLFGVNSNAMPTGIYAPFESIEDDYETLLRFTELNGDVPRGLQRSQINRLPTRQFRASNCKLSEGDEVAHRRADLNKECQVCLSDYVTGDILRILPCFHEFHTPCIDPWLKINHTCPVCRVIVDLED